MKRFQIRLVLLLAFITITLVSITVGCGTESTTPPNPNKSSTSTQSGTKPKSTTTQLPGALSQSKIIMAEAIQANKYVFLVFFKQNDPLSDAMKQAVSTAEQELSARATAAYVDIADPNEKTVIDGFGISKAPIPITVVIAPNGALVKAFPEKVSPEDINNAFVSPKMADIIKATQKQKLIFLYIANSSINYYQENLAVIQEVVETDYKGVADIIEVDPLDQNEASLIKTCKVNIPVVETNLLLINSGSVITRLVGKFDKPTLIKTTASSCSGGSCCPAP